MNQDLKNQRIEYNCPPLEDSFLGSSPLELFKDWFEVAQELYPDTANACTLSTCGTNLRPRGRIVLLKEYSDLGFLFFTNYDSKKGQQLAANPRACLSFFWPGQFRQILIEGNITQSPQVFNQEYFDSRPTDSRYSAAVSRQSFPVASREVLEQELQNLKEKFPEKLPFPSNWGGYWLKPEQIEFWQGRPGRLHDRLDFIREADGSWKSRRLYP